MTSWILHVRQRLSIRWPNVFLGLFLLGFMFNLAYLLWPSPSKNLVIFPDPNMIKAMDALPVLVEARVSEESQYFVVDPSSSSNGKAKAQRYISKGTTSSGYKSKTAFTGVVNINQATSAQLQLLPGIGPKMAERILLYRQQQGPFQSVEDLLNVSGIGSKTLEKMRSHCKI